VEGSQAASAAGAYVPNMVLQAVGRERGRRGRTDGSDERMTVGRLGRKTGRGRQQRGGNVPAR